MSAILLLLVIALILAVASLIWDTRLNAVAVILIAVSLLISRGGLG